MTEQDAEVWEFTDHGPATAGGQRPDEQRPDEQRPAGQHTNGQHTDDQRPAGQRADGQRAVAELRRRIDAGRLENWLHSSRGRQLAVVSNGARAMVMLLDGPGDPGGHAVDPGADGWGDGYLLANGQLDEYPDEDTVPLDRALHLVRHLLDHGAPPPGAPWSVDR